MEKPGHDHHHHQQQQQQQVAVKCPRCDSLNTKFCYYNNYSLSQPRHLCKACKRYWTRGGTLRNVPVGGGCRKTTKRTLKRPISTTTTTTTITIDHNSASSSTSNHHNNININPLFYGLVASNSPCVDDVVNLPFSSSRTLFNNNSRIMSSSGLFDLIQPQPQPQMNALGLGFSSGGVMMSSSTEAGDNGGYRNNGFISSSSNNNNNTLFSGYSSIFSRSSSATSSPVMMPNSLLGSTFVMQQEKLIMNNGPCGGGNTTFHHHQGLVVAPQLDDDESGGGDEAGMGVVAASKDVKVELGQNNNRLELWNNDDNGDGTITTANCQNQMMEQQHVMSLSDPHSSLYWNSATALGTATATATATACNHQPNNIGPSVISDLVINDMKS